MDTMSSGIKPKISHPSLSPNKIGLLERDYEGVMSSLCAGCGHDSVTAAIVRAVYELAIPPHRVAKLSKIGCSSKTPTYFLGSAHGVNSLHGRMPSVATGANAVNRDLYFIGHREIEIPYRLAWVNLHTLRDEMSTCCMCYRTTVYMD